MDSTKTLAAWQYLADQPMLWLAFGVLGALLAGEVFWRVLKLPRITGYTVGGMLVGGAGFGWVPSTLTPALDILTDFALALLLFELGTRVRLRWFRVNRSLVLCSLLDCSLTFIACALVASSLGMKAVHALLIGALAVGTSPAIVVRIAMETRAQGQVTERMLSLTAINTIISIVLVKLIAGFAPQDVGLGWIRPLGNAAYLLLGSLLVGALMAWSFSRLRRFANLAEEHGVALLFAVLLVFFAALHLAALPPLLPPLMAGIVLRNANPRPLLLPRHFGTAGGLLVILLFILNGVQIQWDALFAGGILAVALIAARTLAKFGAVFASSGRGALSLRQAAALAVTLTPFSATALVLTSYLGQNDRALIDPVLPTVLAAVLISELICPILVQLALRHSNESRE
ncbi:cation:proton antiporter [Niveibacterium sp. SC-1]|uniref:cation:proton antiporter n=1 Tax=Niveibacterium sp. SC-1 TaxID=3135646 RepID=UPI00311E9FDF